MSIETNQQSVKKDFTNLSKQNIEILLQAVKENSTKLFDLQKKFDNITKEFYEQAVKDNHFNFQYIPKKFIIKEFCEQAVKDNSYNFEYVPKKFITKELCEQAVKDRSSMFKHVPKKFITKEMCQQAVKDNSYNFEYVPKKFKSFVKTFDDIINS